MMAHASTSHLFKPQTITDWFNTASDGYCITRPHRDDWPSNTKQQCGALQRLKCQEIQKVVGVSKMRCTTGPPDLRLLLLCHQFSISSFAALKNCVSAVFFWRRTCSPLCISASERFSLCQIIHHKLSAAGVARVRPDTV